MSRTARTTSRSSKARRVSRRRISGRDAAAENSNERHRLMIATSRVLRARGMQVAAHRP